MADAGVCFKAGTLIYFKEGFKNIEEVDIGDSVYTFNFEKNNIELSRVVNKLIRQTGQIYEVVVGNQKIYVTGEHPFYVKGIGWTKVKDLKIGYNLLASTNKVVAIKSIRQFSEKLTVYNIEVGGDHNYFVTENAILVHNKYIHKKDFKGSSNNLKEKKHK
jgi:intein/homing endonuclease